MAMASESDPASVSCWLRPTSRRPVPVIDLRFAIGGNELAFFSVVTTIGMPIDVTAEELRIEAIFPADDATASRWRDLAGELQPRQPLAQY